MCHDGRRPTTPPDREGLDGHVRFLGVRDDVQELGEESWRATAATFHSFCLDMLTHYGEPVGVQPGVTVYDDELRGHPLANALRDAGFAAPGPADDSSRFGLGGSHRSSP